MLSFTTDKYGQVLSKLLSSARIIPLGPGHPNLAVRPQLEGVTLSEAFATRTVTNADAARCCLAGLWLYHDFLDESHRISQDVDSPEGSFWHAVMHRREPDAANSKYWWRKVGSHPVLDRLRAESPGIGFAYTDPFAFADYCERLRDSGTPEEEIAMKVQLLEWRLLFDFCFDLATT